MIPNVRVFLSHSSQDKSFARRLAGDLKRHGATAWLDEAALEPGGRWKPQLKKAISGHDFVVVVLTPASVDSTWVQFEIDEALAQGTQAGRVKLIPLLLKDCTVPPALREIQAVHFVKRGSYPRGLQRLVWTLERSWAHPRHQRRPWTKKNLKLALDVGVLRDFNGQLVFSAEVAERLRTYGARWLRGRPIYFSDEVFSDWKEYSGLAVLHAIEDGRLTEEEEVSLAHEAHERLLDFLLDLGVATGVLEDDPDTVKLSEDMGEEMQQFIPRLGELGFHEDTGGELRAATTMLFVELIRNRLIERIPEMVSFAEPLGIVIHNAFGFWTGWNELTAQDYNEA